MRDRRNGRSLTSISNVNLIVGNSVWKAAFKEETADGSDQEWRIEARLCGHGSGEAA
jgi:hypothetical protein